jgi:hypothetical protein
MAFAASVLLFGFSPAAPAQTWVETHPVLTDASSARSTDVSAETKAGEIPQPYREARLRPDVTPKPDDGAKADKGPLDHPANASAESGRRE